MKKRIVSAALAAALVITTFVGCNGNNSGNASNPGSTTGSNTSQTTGTKKFNDVKLKLLSCWNGGVKNPTDTYNNAVATAIRDKIGVTVEIEGIMMSEVEKLNLLFASGDMPDMINAPFWGGNTGETAVIKKAGGEGRLIALDDYINNYSNIKDAWKVGIVSQSFLENDLECKEFNGKHYVLPTQTPGDEADITHWAYGVFARSDVLKKLNIDPATIKTAEDLYNFLVKVRDGGFVDANGNAVIPATTFHNGWDYSGYLTNFRSKQFTDLVKQADGTYTHRALTDDWMNENLYMWKLVKEGLMDKECFKCTDTQANEKVGNGTAVCYSAQMNTGITATKQTGLYTNNPDMKYVPIGPMEYKSGGTKVQLETYGRNGTPGLIFPTSCSNIEAALTWVDFINSKEGLLLSKYGIEGTDYHMVNGQPRMMDDAIARKKAGDDTLNDDRKERGLDLYGDPAILADKSVTLFGETKAGEADAAVPEITAYKLKSPIERVKGYVADKLGVNSPDYTKVNTVVLESQKMNDEIQKAYFADTEAEARAILEAYQNYIKTAEGGALQKYLDYISQQAKTRSDVIN